jgi:hypothetical protein
MRSEPPQSRLSRSSVGVRGPGELDRFVEVGVENSTAGSRYWIKILLHSRITVRSMCTPRARSSPVSHVNSVQHGPTRGPNGVTPKLTLTFKTLDRVSKRRLQNFPVLNGALSSVTVSIAEHLIWRISWYGGGLDVLEKLIGYFFVKKALRLSEAKRHSGTS